MRTLLIDVRRAEDSRDVVHRAVQALAEGKLVVFPTETVYGIAASACLPQAVDRLLSVKGRPEGQPLALAIKSGEDALDYVPEMDRLARRIARRCWPGPVTLVLPDQHPDSLLRRLPENVRKAVAPAGTVGLRVPAHGLVLDVLRLLVGPIVLSSANRSGQPDATTGEAAIAALNNEVDVILDDGPSRYGRPSSVVKVEDGKLIMLREGVVAESTLRRLSSLIVLFVCTGNTCRSPMAEAIARDILSKRIGCPADELEDHGVIVMSAGLAASLGAPATPEAVDVLLEAGVPVLSHESRPITEQLIKQSDLILTMTRGHRDAIVNHWPDVAGRTSVLCRDGGDVTDPIGGPMETYRRCAALIRQELEGRLKDIEIG